MADIGCRKRMFISNWNMKSWLQLCFGTPHPLVFIILKYDLQYGNKLIISIMISIKYATWIAKKETQIIIFVIINLECIVGCDWINNHNVGTPSNPDDWHWLYCPGEENNNWMTVMLPMTTLITMETQNNLHQTVISSALLSPSTRHCHSVNDMDEKRETLQDNNNPEKQASKGLQVAKWGALTS